MITRHSFGLAILLSALVLPAMAATLLTDANLDQFEAMLPKLQQLEQRPQNQQFKLQQHCDWPRHYREISAQEQDSRYQSKIEQLVSQHGFTPVQFVELSAKLSWPVLNQLQPMLEVSRQALMFLPAQQRKNTENSITQGQQYYQTLSSCLTNDDTAALEKHHQRIMSIAKRLGGVDQLLPPGMKGINR
ncbi:hypothetical protein [Rheinheimera maricola]|uniref:DUF3106 domain-containing protein n=1 Tax=Rheinheimera maricola TaxID=2793282 RepID=A0ABS7XDU2_9GAMM|nr:hypothetical protein [Rheinheimera maricola]MBZ9613734.1 hypothetical protein [Rheinheimera maricola]